MSITVIMILAFGMLILAYMNPHRSRDKPNEIVEVTPRYKQVEVEVVDEMTKEKVRNLYEEQEVCNAKIMHLIKQNKQYEQEILKLDNRLQENLDSIRTAVVIQPNSDIRALKASYEESNQNILKHRLRYEGLIIANQEKIVACKKKSNSISDQITKIGMDIYKQRMR